MKRITNKLVVLPVLVFLGIGCFGTLLLEGIQMVFAAMDREAIITMEIRK